MWSIDGLSLAAHILVCWDIPQSLPLVWFHGEPTQGLHSTVDAQAIAHYHVHYPLREGGPRQGWRRMEQEGENRGKKRQRDGKQCELSIRDESNNVY